ncbi:hypothetical protein CPT_Slocum_047 [Serratia phage Slocum]|nr:hypothetical protein CPT_Slocum_047 [Serratia phage Slocum]
MELFLVVLSALLTLALLFSVYKWIKYKHDASDSRMAIVHLHEQRMEDFDELFEARQIKDRMEAIFVENQRVANEINYLELPLHEKTRIIGMIKLR